ncbi:allantoinase [Cryptococcus neoformans C23]|uniref:Allantoinase n=1 Tax=Cryptococcus neoformans (strain H99 / ATCC 208821 / CBS 10515 / FGSC 9487) TaxID=235443 RepID=J9VTY6_CRYN9|nr:allantoinase [Cryptococcus neoformans var. grubii H99]AUB24961.1 allantoinase [Cryptococcus neoformans var. grubii]OWZ31790.1 allantoinase [Cryptococcus neoformans var. grubii AD2-60a]OWZ43865.1 allantoinase [Cryptococcus neoformans var. grubii C23]OXC84598.1 allantoinase [Cryptococcus neoformans var. grubii AD1-7a]AFR95195.1 allantoinase [Cryptococcus neoformans var. grubii H99]|eukprot:XP_012049204.1 allantoinase [Cryptococcus neoformans var. grubii H99]
MPSQTILAPQAILPGDLRPQPATIIFDTDSGMITSVTPGIHKLDENANVWEIEQGKILLPGLIDTHVHLNQPGRTAWEGFRTGTLAAISGGITTLIDMPLNSIPPTTTLSGLATKRACAKEVGVSCDLGFWGGLVPGNEEELRGLWEAGVKGFKCFLIESGVDEFPCVGEQDIIKACDALKGTNALIMFHAELDAQAHAHAHADPHNTTDPSEYSTFLESRPQQWEISALQLILRIARSYPDLRFHIVHLSASDAVPLLQSAFSGDDALSGDDAEKALNGEPSSVSSPLKNLTVETCFHYLCLRDTDIPPNATQFKCCPPIRDESNRLKLVDALLDGTIQYVVSDHSPCVPELKRGDFMSAWGGVSGLGLGLSLLWTELGAGGRVELGRIVEWMGPVQARQVGLQGKKGVIQQGAAADFVVFDPNAEFEVTLETLRFKNKVSPYIGKRLRGLVEKTYVGGKLVWDNGRAGGAAVGRFV